MRRAVTAIGFHVSLRSNPFQRKGERLCWVFGGGAVMTAVHDHIDSIAEFDWDLVTFVVQWARYGVQNPKRCCPDSG